MKFDQTLIPCTFIKRYKRFLTDLSTENGGIITAHCPNSGRMTGCIGGGYMALVSESDNPARKLKYTLEMTHNGKTWIVVNTNHANRFAYESIQNGDIPELASLINLRREVKYGKSSRIDILGEDADGRLTYIEVKSVTMTDDNGCFCFPDAPTVRGRKHLMELRDMAEAGHRAVMLFIILRQDGKGFRTADFIDPEYSELFEQVCAAGVEAYAYRADITPDEITLSGREKIIFNKRS